MSSVPAPRNRRRARPRRASRAVAAALRRQAGFARCGALVALLRACSGSSSTPASAMPSAVVPVPGRAPEPAGRPRSSTNADRVDAGRGPLNGPRTLARVARRPTRRRSSLDLSTRRARDATRAPEGPRRDGAGCRAASASSTSSPRACRSASSALQRRRFPVRARAGRRARAIGYQGRRASRSRPTRSWWRGRRASSIDCRPSRPSRIDLRGLAAHCSATTVGLGRGERLRRHDPDRVAVAVALERGDRDARVQARRRSRSATSIGPFSSARRVSI